ncbi:MAG: NUDIX hydrolase [Burkholderiaceae bacterium]|jgi:ADP-ribose pyrophosphatase|nr:NUDIX hydrolase [Burkholderiaceae bacterium]
MTTAQGPLDPLAEETLESRLVYRGQFLRVYEDTVRCPDGHVAPREFLRHPGAVMVVPQLDDGRLVLERQFRYPLGRSIIEFPAGKIDPGEDILSCAQRELREETGYVAREWTYLGGFHNAVGYCDEKIEVYLARGLTFDSTVDNDGEVLEVFTATLDELLGWIDAGTVTDVKTIIGAYWLQRRFQGKLPSRSPES